ncbi:MAG TPA: DUF2997 domain-containing protein [Chloroflexota bacterium]|nr:DUF2997 domain-containing protein [Chloroflexota bacterium]
MREIEFTIDPATGELTIHVKGIAGSDCADVAKLASELLGTPTHDWNTPEYYLRPQVRRRVQPRRKP